MPKKDAKTDSDYSDIEQTLFQGRIQGIVAIFHQNERPLSGLAGLLDWRFHGAISKNLRTGEITGKEGECVYLPIQRNGTVYHVILAGAGYSKAPGTREPISETTLKGIQRNLKALRIPKMGVSQRDFGFDEKDFDKYFKGVDLCVAM